MTPKTPISPKAIAGAIGALVPGVILAVLLNLQDNPEVISGLPVWLQSLLVAVLPALIAYVAAYQKADPLRDAGAASMPVQPLGEGLDDTGSASLRFLVACTLGFLLAVLLPLVLLPLAIVGTLVLSTLAIRHSVHAHRSLA